MTKIWLKFPRRWQKAMSHMICCFNLLSQHLRIWASWLKISRQTTVTGKAKPRWSRWRRNIWTSHPLSLHDLTSTSAPCRMNHHDTAGLDFVASRSCGRWDILIWLLCNNFEICDSEGLLVDSSWTCWEKKSQCYIFITVTVVGLFVIFSFVHIGNAFC